MNSNASVRVRDSRGRFCKRPESAQIKLSITTTSDFWVWDYHLEEMTSVKTQYEVCEYQEFDIPFEERMLLDRFAVAHRVLCDTYTKLTGHHLVNDIRVLENNLDWYPGRLKRNEA